jgi:hypothetical protein
MRSALIEQPRSFVNLCLLPSELQIVVELLMATTTKNLQVHRVSHILRIERTREDVRQVTPSPSAYRAPLAHRSLYSAQFGIDSRLPW